MEMTDYVGEGELPIFLKSGNKDISCLKIGCTLMRVIPASKARLESFRRMIPDEPE
jgi:hypothetical protein